MKIAVDAMGSDSAPHMEIEGAIQATKALGVHVVLVGNESVLVPLLKEKGGSRLPIEIRHASQVVAMDEQPAMALRST